MVLLLVSLLLTTPAPIEAQKGGPGLEKPAIAERQVLELVQKGTQVAHRTVPAMAIVEAVKWSQGQDKRGKLDEFASLTLSDCIVHGDLDLSGQTVPISFALHDVTFDDMVKFKDTTFSSVVNISGATFKSVTLFDDAHFGSSVDFSLNTFQSFTSFSGARFTFESKFYEQTFEHPVIFTGATFARATQFDHLTFRDDVDFSRAIFEGPVRFERATFGGLASFRDLDLRQNVTFAVTTFSKDAFFDDLAGRPSASLEFFGVTFAGRAYFDNSQVENLRFSPRFSDQDISAMAGPGDPQSGMTGEFARRFYSPTVFEKLAVFRGLQSDRADFTEAELQDQADFIGARFGSLARFTDATFKGEVNFFGAGFPRGAKSTTLDNHAQIGLLLDGTHFRDRVLLNWSQLVEQTPWWKPWGASRLKVVTANPTTWYSLEEVFRRSGNLHGQNESLYERRLLSRNLGDTVDETPFSNWVAWLFWGYGVRPFRLLLWIGLVFIVFTFLYWTQVPGSGRSRIRAAIEFSIRNSWRLNYGFERAVTPQFKVITLVHSITSKVMGLFLLESLANVSPLLNSVLGKLLPT